MAHTNQLLGDALGLSPSSASRMRSGKRSGSIATLMRIAEITEAPLEDVVRASGAEDDTEWVGLLDAVCEKAAASKPKAPAE